GLYLRSRRIPHGAHGQLAAEVDERSALPAVMLNPPLDSTGQSHGSNVRRRAERKLTQDQLQLTLSTTPHVAPVTLASRVKGRIQHHCRQRGTLIDFSRKLAVRSVGDPTRAEVEA